MSKNLLVTLADKNHLDQAKQLFSSAYFNAGWQGDYMLLAHDIPKDDLEWFRNKGILIKHYKPLYEEQIGGMSEVLITKFYLFTPEFKKWDNIIYLDADIIIRASLDELMEVKGFAAVTDPLKFSGQFINSSLPVELKESHDPEFESFNAGFFVFNTKLIEEETFNKLVVLTNKYMKIIKNGDQPIFNLFFYKKWQKLPSAYSIFVSKNYNIWRIKLKNIKGILIHFIGPDKPWHNKHYFYQEWKSNLDKADKIDLQNIPAGQRWSKRKINAYSRYLDLRYDIIYFYYFVDNKIGRFGGLLKKYSPSLYQALKKMKGSK